MTHFYYHRILAQFQCILPKKIKLLTLAFKKESLVLLERPGSFKRYTNIIILFVFVAFMTWTIKL